MGFLKRLFSMGGKKHSKAKSTTKPEISNPMPSSKRASKYYTAPAAPYSSSTPALLKVDEDPEVAVHRLLRSSSARWAVAHEVDHSDLPPMPHPINDVLSAHRSHSPDPMGYSTLHQTLSTASLTSACLSRGGSYSVKVYGKQRLSSGPEEILANEKKRNRASAAHLNANDSRTLKLHSEPSIVSLVSLYDDQGRLPDEAFSNDNSNDSQPTPRRKRILMPTQEEEEVPKEGRAQTKRSGSTLRQLLGASTNGKSEDASEGDISWAERFLNEVNSVETDAPTTSSTRSSFALPTPDSVQGHGFADVSIATSDMTVDNPAISSMDVELSISTTASHIFDDPPSSGAPKSSKDSTFSDHTKTPTRRPLNLSTGHTPQKRASQVFNFIKKRASKVVEQSGPDLPGPPKVLNSSTSDTRRIRRPDSKQGREEQHNTESQATPRFSSDKTSGIPVHARDLATPSRRSGSSQLCDEPEREMHLTPRFALERAIGIPLYSGDMATPKPRKPQPDRIDSGGLENMGRLMLEELSSSRGSLESADEQAESEREPEVRALSNLCATAHTPMRPIAETEAEKKEREVRILMTGPTKVIVTAPTPGTARHAEQTGYSLARIPRGPRTQNTRRRRTSGSDREERRRHRQDRENGKRERPDKEKHHYRSNSCISSTPQSKVPPRRYSHRSSSSVSSVASNENVHPNYGAVYAEAKRFVESSDRHLAHANKARAGAGLGVKADIPATPLRTSKRTAVNRDTFQPPATVHEGVREERRKPRGERHSYALARSARV